MSDNVKTAIVAIIVVAVIAVAYIAFPPQVSTTLDKGNEINSDTFVEILSETENVYIVMDLRGVSDVPTRTGILQCGVDFAGSIGLVDKDVSYISLDDEDGCIFANSAEGKTYRYEIYECMAMLDDGISLYIIPGDGTEYYTKAAVIGVDSDYQTGTCGIGVAEYPSY